MIDLYQYKDYRKYLRDYCQYMKSTTPYYSFRYFSNKLGSSSPSWLKFIMNGERNLASKSIDRFIRALRLGKRKGAYFRALVLYNQAKNELDKETYLKDLVKLSRGLNAKKVGKDRFEFYSKWYYSVVRQLVELPGFKEDQEWIAKQLLPSIKPVQAKQSLRILKELEFVKYNKDNRLEQSNPTITTGDEVESMVVRDFHRQMLNCAVAAIDEVPKEEREISSVTMTMTKRCFRMLKDRIQEFEKEIQGMVEQECEEPEEVYQFNVQFFPMTARKKVAK